MTFSGTTLSTNLLNPTHTNQQGNGWTCSAFIKDFAPDYSSSVITRVDLATNTTPDFHCHLHHAQRCLPAAMSNGASRRRGRMCGLPIPILPGLGKIPLLRLTRDIMLTLRA